MFPDIVSGEHTYERYGNVGDAYEPLAVEHLGGNTYSFMTYFKQNGDVMRDPDFEFELDHENKTLNITHISRTVLFSERFISVFTTKITFLI